MAKKQGSQDSVEDIELALTKTERYIEENQKSIMIIIGSIVLVILLFLAVRNFYIRPQEKEAANQMYVAEQYFEQDSFNLALNGDGNNLGFLDIISEYKITKSADLATLYAGLSYLHLEDYENAIAFLSDYSSDDHILGPSSMGALGDAYVEIGDFKSAASAYRSAYRHKSNAYTTPRFLVKAAMVEVELGNIQEALDLYQRVKIDYPGSTQANQVDKNIAQLEMLLRL
jgi:TolA-binding protein